MELLCNLGPWDKPNACVNCSSIRKLDFANFKKAMHGIPKGFCNIMLAEHSYLERVGGRGVVYKVLESIACCETCKLPESSQLVKTVPFFNVP